MSKSAPKKTTGKIAEASKAPETSALGETAGATPESAPSAARAPMLWAIAFSACVTLLIVSTVAVVILAYTPVPRLDQWVVVLWLKNYYAGQWHLSDLWQQHNEHRILFPMLFLLMDWFLFKGTNVFLLCSILLLQAGHAWIFMREVRAWNELPREVRLTVIAIIAALFFSGANLENFTWPFQISFILAFYAGTVSVYALIRCAEQRGKRKVREATVRWFAASVGSGIVATYSLSNGILIWPALLLTGLMVKIWRRALLLIGVVFGLLSVLYFSGYHFIAIHTDPREALQHPIRVLGYVCAYLALPLTSINHIVGAAVGLIVLIAFVWKTFRVLRRPAPRRVVALSIGVMLYITAGAFVTALGRLTVGPPEAAPRYATPVSVFWACALLVVLAETETFPQKATAIATTLATAITGLGITILPLHLENSSRFLQVARAVHEAEPALAIEVAANNQLAAIFPPDPTLPLRLIDVLRQNHRSLFAGNQVAVGEPLPPDYQVVSRDRCRGIWEFTTILDGPDKPGESASGWAWENALNHPPRMVLFLDDAKVIRGFANFTRDREDVAAALRNGRMASSGWFGFARHVEGNHPYRAYAVLHDGRSLCPLSNAADVPKSVYAVFRRGEWAVDSNKTGGWEPEDRTFRFGLAGDLAVAGDWDGTGITRAGVFRNGQWYLDWNNNGQWDAGDRQISFGMPGDLPVVGDWNHTGVTKIGVFRNGTWILDWNGAQRYGPGVRQFTFGAPGDIPVVGNWDGSGVTRIGVFRRGIWYLDMNGDFQLDNRDKVAAFGLPTDQPVTGDWNGLGVTRLGIFRNGQWILDSNGNLQFDATDKIGFFGLPGDVAVPWK